MSAREVRAAAAMAGSGLLLGAGFPWALRGALGLVRGGSPGGLAAAAGCWLACAALVVAARHLRGRTPWTLGLEILWLLAALAGLAAARMLPGGA